MISIEVDTVLDAAYIQLSDEEIVRTVEHNEDILVDLDAMGVAVGIEVLRQTAELPFTELCERYHVHSDTVELLRRIRPTVAAFVTTQTGNDGVSNATSASLVAC